MGHCQMGDSLWGWADLRLQLLWIFSDHWGRRNSERHVRQLLCRDHPGPRSQLPASGPHVPPTLLLIPTTLSGSHWTSEILVLAQLPRGTHARNSVCACMMLCVYKCSCEHLYRCLLCVYTCMQYMQYICMYMYAYLCQCKHALCDVYDLCCVLMCLACAFMHCAVLMCVHMCMACI